MDDIIVGTRLGGVHYYRRLVPGDVYLTGEDSLLAGARPMDVGYNSAPCVTDWNGDGLPDLVVGRVEGVPGGLYLFTNTGAPGSPSFPAFGDTLMCGAEFIRIYYSYPDLCDVNLDGLPDLVSGSGDGFVWCFVNSGEPGAPLFEETSLLELYDGSAVHLYGPARPTTADWNLDGLPDLIVGDAGGFVSWFPGLPPMSAGGGDPEPGMGLSVRNPASDPVVLSVSLDRACADPVARVYDLSGRIAAEEHPGPLQPGTTDVLLDLEGCPEGLYVVLCTAGDCRASLIFTLL